MSKILILLFGVLNFSLPLGQSLDAVSVTIPTKCNLIHLSQISSVLPLLPHPPPCTLLCSVLLWACASALQTLLKSPYGLTLPSFVQQSIIKRSLWPLLFLLDLPLLFTIHFSFYYEVFYCSFCTFSFILFISLESFAFTYCYSASQEPLCICPRDCLN